MRNPERGHGQIEEALRGVRRRSDMFSIVLVALVVAVIVPFWVASPPPLEAYALANIAILLGLPLFIVVSGRLGLRQLKRSLESVRSRIREAGIVSLMFVAVTLDNGLLLQLSGDFAFLSAFFSSGGHPLSPSLGEVRRWMSPFRWARLVTFRAGKKAPELVALGGALGVRFAAASVGRYRPRRFEFQPNPPAWSATVTFSQAFGPSIRVDRVVGEADRIAAYLRNIVQDTRDRVRSTPLPHA